MLEIPVNANLLPLPKDQLPEPLTAIVTDNPKRVICGNCRYNAISKINEEVRSLSLFDSGVYLSTKDHRISDSQSIRVRDHYQKESPSRGSAGSLAAADNL